MIIRERETESPPAKKVVVVDDDDDYRRLVQLMLADGTGAMVELITAENGQSGLAAIRAHHPDVVILDLVLPDMHGWEVFMVMRGEAESAGIPVIILSSYGTRHDRSFGLQVARVHDYLTKPCLPSRLRESVATAFRN